MDLSNGYISESIYLLNGSRLQATYRRENDTYTKLIPPSNSPIKIKAKEYEAQRARLDAAPELSLDTCFDL